MSEPTSSQASDFISTRQAAATLGVALSTVQLWVETGILPAWKTAGGHRRIPRSAVDSLVSQQKSAMAPQPLKQIKVLVVEDDVIQLELYKRKFADWPLPIELLTAHDGFEGLMMVGRHNPDLIITDLRMPGMDGFRMIRHLLSQTSGHKPDIIVVTALNDTEMEAASGLLPGIPIYHKPVPFTALRVLIENKIQNNPELSPA
jgi:excisionase family DNA binding protein